MKRLVFVTMILVISCRTAPVAPSVPVPSTAMAPQATMNSALTPVTVDKSGWWLRMCTEHSESHVVEISIGADENHHEEIVWPAQGTGGQPAPPPATEINVPTQYKSTNPLWVRVRVLDNGKHVNFCLVWQQTSSKVFDTFREQTETVPTTSTQACTCTITP